MSAAKKTYLNAAFVVCISLLITVAVAKEAIIHALGVTMIKQPIDLRNSFDDLDESVLLPYEVKHKSAIDRETLESLGTENYLQWTLENKDVAASSPLRYCSLFLTYYTGNPDMVPHVPDECYVGGGKSRLGAEAVYLDIPVNEAKIKKVGFQSVRFGQIGNSALQNEQQFTVQYLFHVNGKYTADRTETRLALGSNWFCKYSYFSKVEWRFYGIDSFGMVYPDKEQTLEASKELLSGVLPQLEQRHWPDWDKAKEE